MADMLHKTSIFNSTLLFCSIKSMILIPQCFEEHHSSWLLIATPLTVHLRFGRQGGNALGPECQGENPT